MDCLYISHTGMTEPLGRSQVLPYVLGLARRGLEIEILSHEPAGTPAHELERTRALIESAGVGWLPQVRSPSHHLGVKVWESGRAAIVGLVRALRKRPRIVHARSYLPAAVADVVASVAPGAKMVFDLRGMLGDEYVDAGYWTEQRLEYKLLKRFERRAFQRADGIVVLTEALRSWLREHALVPAQTPIAVIPCCVETDRFHVASEVRRAAREELGVGGRPVLLYSGSLGSWYQEKEMAAFAAALRKKRPDLTWLVLTRSDPHVLLSAAAAHGIRDVVVRSVRPADMPRNLAAGDVGLSFIRPCFSKMGSSPTKLAEYLATGMVVAANGGVGDVGQLEAEKGACVILPGYGADQLESAAARVLDLLERSGDRAAVSREAATRLFDVHTVGVERYADLYGRLGATGRPDARP